MFDMIESLTPVRKIIFIACLCVVFLTLLYLVLNLDTAFTRVSVYEEYNGCVYRFHNGELHNLSCPEDLSYIEKITNKTWKESDYIEERRRIHNWQPGQFTSINISDFG